MYSVWLGEEPSDRAQLVAGSAAFGSESYIGPNIAIWFLTRDELREVPSKKASGARGEEPAKIGENAVIQPNCAVYSGESIGDDIRFDYNVPRALMRERQA